METKYIFLYSLQGSVVTEFFHDTMKTISEFSKCLAFAVVEVHGKLPMYTKEINYYQRICFMLFIVYFAETLL